VIETKYSKLELVCMENSWQEWAVCLPVVLVKEILFFVQECINITEEGKA
jgi:hypothetical protein